MNRRHLLAALIAATAWPSLRARAQTGPQPELPKEKLVIVTHDGQHLFFLDSDLSEFSKRYGSNVYYNVDYLGKIDSAYDIFAIYDDRVTARIEWIFAELKKPLDFTANDTYRLDRSKSAWPSTALEADELVLAAG